MIKLLKYEQPEHLMWEVQNFEVAYAVSGEAHDYVEETSIRLRQFAKQQFTYPFYLYFESYYDATDEILADTNVPITYKPSGRTVLTQTGRKCFQAEVPTFTVEIRNENDLNEAFSEWFRYAFDNLFWAIRQTDSITYKNGFPYIELQESELILLTEHDAYGFTVVTNRIDLQQENHARKLVEELYVNERQGG